MSRSASTLLKPLLRQAATDSVRSSCPLARSIGGATAPARLSFRLPPLAVQTAQLAHSRTFTHTPIVRNSSTSDGGASPPAASTTSSASSSEANAVEEPRLSLTFTCAVPNCGHRSAHTFTKRSYEHGIVLVQCPNCKNRHLIADHLSWFTQSNDEPKTIEQIIAAKGGRIRKGVQYTGKGDEYETMEILSDEQFPGGNSGESDDKGR